MIHIVIGGVLLALWLASNTAGPVSNDDPASSARTVAPPGPQSQTARPASGR
jgi:hypothetical protein